jgi:Pentapeptide repeats (9 copies)
MHTVIEVNKDIPAKNEGCSVPMFGGKACGRPLYRPSKGPPHCLMHSVDPNKDDESFQKEFERILKDAGEGWADFTGFVFPVSNYSGGAVGVFAQAKGREFVASCCFNNARFLQNADFARARFVRDAHFCSVRFELNANFAGAVFGGDALFGNTTFGFNPFRKDEPSDKTASNSKDSGGANFAGATFAKIASFRDARFYKKNSFAQASFIQNADFASVHFHGTAEYVGATFTQDADFTSSRFAQDANFTFAKFYGGARWEILSLGTRWAPPLLSFINAKFMRPEEATFFNTCLERALFHMCDVSKIGFSTVQWHRRDRNGMRMVFDEVVLLEPLVPGVQKFLKPPPGDPNPMNYLVIAETYQQLKHNYDSKAEYWTAGDFHYGEMEMKRLNSNSRNKLVRWLHSNMGLIAWYKYASEYGQNYVLPVVWFLALVLVFTLIYPLPRIGLDKPASVGKPLTYAHPSGPCDNPDQVWKNRANLLGHSLMTALSIAAFDKEPFYKPHYPAGRLFAYVELLLSSTVIAIFLLAVRRQFRR